MKDGANGGWTEPVKSHLMHPGFPAIARADARVLILGTLPGARSLQAQEYYAQPRNAFWKIMEEIIGAAPDLPYAVRIEMLRDSGIALWDVYAAAARTGSLDSSIKVTGSKVNSFSGFLNSHPKIRLICFNGHQPADVFRQRILPTLPQGLRDIPRVTFPSTSATHARMPFVEKLRIWREGLESAGVCPEID